MAHWMARVHITAVAAILTAAVLLPTPSAAQLNGQNIKGDAGLKSGSQPPPGAYVVVPLWFYTADAVKDHDGRELLHGSLDSTLFGGGLIVVTPKTLLGGRYGFMAVLPAPTIACRAARTSTPTRALG
jgi:hypothetical protein